MDLSRYLQCYRLKLLIIFVSLLKGQKYKITFWKKRKYHFTLCRKAWNFTKRFHADKFRIIYECILIKEQFIYSHFEKGCRKNVHATIPKGNMGYDQYTVLDDCSCRTYFCCFPLALANTFPWPFVPILSNFFEKQRTQNHPQCLSGLSRALFPTTFLEIAVYFAIKLCFLKEKLNKSSFLWHQTPIICLK